MPRNQTTTDERLPSAWAAAITDLLGARRADREQAWPNVHAPSPKQALETVHAALQALVATGRAIAYDGHGRFLPLTGIAVAEQAESWAVGRPVKPGLAGVAFALEGEAGRWIVNVERLTYLPARRGAKLDRAVLHLRLGPLLGVPFIHDQSKPGQPPHLHFGAGGCVLLAEADLDVPYLLGDGLDPNELDGLGERIREGRPRASFVPPDERIRKAEAIAAVRAAYLAHRGDSPRALQQEDVDVIVRTGLEQGLLISLDLVHAATDNRGSPNSVYPKLADAMQRLAPRRPAADDPDPSLIDLWQRLQQAATASAEAALDPVRQAVEDERASLTAERTALAAERAKDERAAAERARAAERLEQELAEARAQITSLQHIERGQTAELASAAAERERLRADLRRQELAAAEAEAMLQQAVAAEREAQQVATRAADAAQAQLVEQQQTEAVLRAALAEASRVQADQTTRHAALQQTADGLRDAVAQARAAAAAAAAGRDEARQQRAADQAEAAEARRRADTNLTTQRERAARLAEQLAEARADLRAAQGERDRLADLLERWKTPTPAPLAAQATDGDTP